MGTDIFLVWEGMTESERKIQLKASDYAGGKYGYLRAAVWDDRWNAVYRALFPEAFDLGKVSYDFTDADFWRRMYKAVAQALRVAMEEVEKDNMDLGNVESFFYRELVRAKSVYDFFALARRKQNEGKKVWVDIYW